MAQRYQGDPYRVESSADGAKLLSYTAQLPPGQFDGALLRFADEFGGNMYWIYYMVVDTPATKAWTIRRVHGMSGDFGNQDIPPQVFRDLSNIDIRRGVQAIQAKYRGDASLVQSRREKADAKRRAESREFSASGTIRVK